MGIVLQRMIGILFMVMSGLSIGLLVFGLLFTPQDVVQGQAVYTPQTKVMQDFIEKTNTLRSANGKPTLIADAQLEASASIKLQDMNNDGYWGHYNPDGSDYSTIIWDQKPQAKTVGENLARCFASYDEAFNALVASPTHYAVLMGDFSSIGVASAFDPRGCESIVMHVSS